VKEGCTPDERQSNVALLIYKGKEDPMECGSYRRIKLLEHASFTFLVPVQKSRRAVKQFRV